jgi:hypothetical protein
MTRLPDHVPCTLKALAVDEYAKRSTEYLIATV